MSTQDNRLSLADVEALYKVTATDARFSNVPNDPEWVANLAELVKAQANFLNAQTFLQQQEATMYAVAKRYYPPVILIEAKYTM